MKVALRIGILPNKTTQYTNVLKLFGGFCFIEQLQNICSQVIGSFTSHVIEATRSRQSFKAETVSSIQCP